MMQDVCYIGSQPGNPRNSEGAFLSLRDGRVIFIYTRYEGHDPEDNASADLALLESADDGLTWPKAPRIVLARGNADNIMSVSLLRLHSGRIMLLYVRNFTSPDGEQHCVPYEAFSDDEAATWTTPRLVLPDSGYHVVCNDRLVQLSTGRIIIPVSPWIEVTAPERKKVMVTHFLLSDDEGATWRSCRDYWYPPVNTKSLQEPGVVELADGRLWAWARTSSNYQFGAYSSDGGETWSEVKPLLAFCSPLSPMTVKRNPVSQRLTAVWNDHQPRWNVPVPTEKIPHWKECKTAGRTPFVLAESGDEGQHWQATLLEDDPKRGFSYTAMHFTSTALLLGYCCGGLNGTMMLQDLKIRRIPFDPATGALNFK
ncbi:MAG: exo-alpha-sialidase [Oligosphaeraceae bacterium]|nr:exo-alpha-sialidase [Oligosphaeraceae bacterium]